MQATPSRDQRLEAIKRATANALATVAVGRGRLQAARTVRAHVQAAILLCELEQRAAYILHMGNYAAGGLQSTTPQVGHRSDMPRFYPDELPKLTDVAPNGGGPFIERIVDTPTAMERGGEL